jgi:acyl transferase domain-containing protein
MPAPLQDDVAIVGMACRFAGASDVAEFWRNIVANTPAIGDHPHPLAPRLLAASAARFDRLITQRGGYLRDRNVFTPAAFGLAPAALAGANPDQFLALQLCADALRHARLDREALPGGRSGVILGVSSPLNAATGNWLQHGLVLDQTASLLQRLFPTASETQMDEIRQGLKAALPPVNAAALRSAFGHAAPGLCAATLGIAGPATAVDAGAASALQAVRLALDELRLGRCDVMLAGAVQHGSSLHFLMGLACLLGFTTRDFPCPLNRDADGTLPGEGGAFLVLKRRRDAERQRDTVYALIKGVGLAASDATSLGVRPEPHGLVSAMQNGQDEAGVDPATIGLVEAHGSAVPREDQLEIGALRQVFPDGAGRAPGTLVGSVKAQIGHCFAAAGMAGLVKAALALHHRVLPPMFLANGRVHARLVQARSPFYVTETPRPWILGRRQPPRRAAVNALECACVHAHAVLEEYG